MAKNQQFHQALNRLRQKIKDKIKQIENFDDEVLGLACDVFVQRARKRLVENANTNQRDLLESLKGNIYHRKSKDRHQVIVENDAEGLMMFLEYGTGLVGEEMPHEEASRIGWDYAINEPDYVNYGDKRGWFFKPDENTYIDRNDIEIKYKRSYKKGTAKAYSPVLNSKYPNREAFLQEETNFYSRDVWAGETTKTVFSQGIEPVRYIYETKQELLDIFETSRGNMTILKQKLEGLSRRKGI